jgi:hypothetical protein
MTDVQALLARCQELGTTLTPGPDGKLKVRAPAPLPEALRQELKQRKAEVLALLSQQPAPWPCPHCGTPAEIEAVGPSLDGQRVLTYWHCPPCQTWGVTPDSIRQPPVWAAIPGQGLGGERRRDQGRPTPSREAKRGAGHGQFSGNSGWVSGPLQGEPHRVSEGWLGRHTSP